MERGKPATRSSQGQIVFSRPRNRSPTAAFRGCPPASSPGRAGTAQRLLMASAIRCWPSLSIPAVHHARSRSAAHKHDPSDRGSPEVLRAAATPTRRRYLAPYRVQARCIARCAPEPGSPAGMADYSGRLVQPFCETASQYERERTSGLRHIRHARIAGRKKGLNTLAPTEICILPGGHEVSAQGNG